MILNVFIFLVGLTLLYFGAEWLVSGASTIALRLGITPIIVGCTVVAFGTSAPELVVSLAAVYTGSDDISVGNIIGSNIANLALILGVAALIRPMMVQAAIIRREFPVMLVATLMLCMFGYDGRLSQLDGVILLTAMAAYIAYMFVIARMEMRAGGTPDIAAELEDVDVEGGSNVKDGIRIVLGIIGLAGGAQLMVNSAVSIATVLGVPQMIIGISVVAVGTSLPELATSVVAAYRGESDISVGNVVGSNIFNTFMVLGLVGTLAGVTVGYEAVEWDLWVMLGVTVLAWPIMWTGRRIGRIEGAVLLGIYCAYIAWIFFR